MKNKEKKIIGTIIHMAGDKQNHIMYRDCLSWMEVKMKEIKRIASMIPHIKYKNIDKNDKEMKDVWREPKGGYMDIIETEYISTIQNMQWKLEDFISDQKLGLQDGQREYLMEVVGDVFNKVLYKGSMLNLDKEQTEHLKKVIKELSEER